MSSTSIACFHFGISHGPLYVGVTSNLVRRVTEHRLERVPGFTKKYRVHRLVHFECFGDYYEAIAREKRLKRWRREWKITLIEEENPNWVDLFPGRAPGFQMGPGSR